MLSKIGRQCFTTTEYLGIDLEVKNGRIGAKQKPTYKYAVHTWLTKKPEFCVIKQTYGMLDQVH